jgi:predicted PurR-regulated permease PerM
MAEHRERGEERDGGEIRVRRSGPVPPEAVVPPRAAELARRDLRPEHLYKAAALLFLFAVLFHYLEPVARVLLLAYAAAIAAIILNSVVQALPGRRDWMTGLLGLVILALIGTVLWFGVPLLFSQIRDLASRVPEFGQLLADIERWLRTNTGLNVSLVSSRAREFLQQTFLSTSGGGGQLLTQARGLLEALLIPLLILFGGLYAAGKPNDRLLSPVLRAVPRDRRLAFRRVLQLLGDRILGWVRGIMLAMVAVGILSYVGYRLAGVPNPLALAVFAGLTEAIPLLGPWIGGAAAVTVGLLESPTTGLYAALVALAVQQIEGNLITPWAMSRAAEVHPFITLFALLLFGTLFGFLGILLAIPIVLLIWTLVEVLWVERAIDTDQDPIDPVVED